MINLEAAIKEYEGSRWITEGDLCNVITHTAEMKVLVGENYVFKMPHWEKLGLDGGWRILLHYQQISEKIGDLFSEIAIFHKKWALQPYKFVDHKGETWTEFDILVQPIGELWRNRLDKLGSTYIRNKKAAGDSFSLMSRVTYDKQAQAALSEILATVYALPQLHKFAHNKWLKFEDTHADDIACFQDGTLRFIDPGAGMRFDNMRTRPRKGINELTVKNKDYQLARRGLRLYGAREDLLKMGKEFGQFYELSTGLEFEKDIHPDVSLKEILENAWWFGDEFYKRMAGIAPNQITKNTLNPDEAKRKLEADWNNGLKVPIQDEYNIITYWDQFRRIADQERERDYINTRIQGNDIVKIEPQNLLVKAYWGVALKESGRLDAATLANQHWLPIVTEAMAKFKQMEGLPLDDLYGAMVAEAQLLKLGGKQRYFFDLFKELQPSLARNELPTHIHPLAFGLEYRAAVLNPV